MRECCISNAKALLELELPSGQIEDIRTMLQGSRELVTFLNDPVITARQKEHVMEKIGEKAGLDPKLVNFLKRCCVVEIPDQIPQIVECYQELLDQKEGIINGTLYYAGDSDPDQLIRQATEDITRRVSGAKVKLTAVRDDSLLGGYLVRAGGVEYDKSFSGQLDRLINRINNRR